VLAAARAAGADGFLDWGGGLALLAGPANDTTHAAITRGVRAQGGTWTVLRGPAPWRAGIDVVPPEAAPLAALTRRVKAAMDPAGVLNPGRIFVGV
jgi:glycolate oxidase FAD binding subunit